MDGEDESSDERPDESAENAADDGGSTDRPTDAGESPEHETVDDDSTERTTDDDDSTEHTTEVGESAEYTTEAGESAGYTTEAGEPTARTTDVGGSAGGTTEMGEPAQRVTEVGGEGVSPSAPPVGGVRGATAREEAALRRARAVSELLDDAFRVPGTDFRVGLDPVLGIVPGAGDAIAAAASLYPIAEAYRLGAPRRTLARMLALVAIDLTVGSVPVLGPVFDAFWKANEWNVRTLERHVREA